MLYVICGQTCAGKDTVIRNLLENNKRLKRIISYTTRPPRIHEVHGVDYWFEPDNSKSVGGLCIKTYKSAKGNWTYWFDKSEIKHALKSSKDMYICITDAEGAYELQEMGAVIIYIYAPFIVRLERYFKRESKNTIPDYEEVIRRMLADYKAFEKLEQEAICDKEIFFIDTATTSKVAAIEAATVYMIANTKSNC